MISNLLPLKCNVFSRRETIGHMKTSFQRWFGKYVNILNVRIYFHFHISAPHHTSHEVPPATIESEGVYDNIEPCRYDNMIIIVENSCKHLYKHYIQEHFYSDHICCLVGGVGSLTAANSYNS